MTENEAIKEFNKMVGQRMRTKQGISEKQLALFQIAMDALEKIQQYRALGTVEELREAMEKQRSEKPKLPSKNSSYYSCPICDGTLSIHQGYCQFCGQAIDWR